MSFVLDFLTISIHCSAPEVLWPLRQNVEVIVDSRSHYADGFDKSIFHCRSVFKGLYRPKLCKKKIDWINGIFTSGVVPIFDRDLYRLFVSYGFIKLPYNEAVIILPLHLFVTFTVPLVNFSPHHPQFTPHDYQLIQPFCSLWSDTSKRDDSQFKESVQLVLNCSDSYVNRFKRFTKSSNSFTNWTSL